MHTIFLFFTVLSSSFALAGSSFLQTSPFTISSGSSTVVCVTEVSNHVSVVLMGQLGNQLFQIATAYAYALDHQTPLLVPDLVNNKAFNIPHNKKILFQDRINSQKIPWVANRWKEPSFNYSPIPSLPNLELFGYFQSEKYFKHRRQELLELFKAPQGLNEKILTKYPFLASDAFVVGIQIRDYRQERPLGDYHPTKTRSYYETAMSYFPEDTIFLVSSNNLALAQECTEGVSPNIIYLSADYIEEFYTLVLCKSFIIANSSFGWWASWLSTAQNKTVIAPSVWFAPPYNNEYMTRDIFPEGCTLINE